MRCHHKRQTTVETEVRRGKGTRSGKPFSRCADCGAYLGDGSDRVQGGEPLNVAESRARFIGALAQESDTDLT